MIKSEIGLKQTLEVMVGQYEVLAELHRRIAPVNFRNYLILAQGSIDMIRQFQQEINEYLQVSEQMAAPPDEPPAEPLAESPQPAASR
jgi:hypothetical protein